MSSALDPRAALRTALRLWPVRVSALLALTIVLVWPLRHVMAPRVEGVLSMWCAAVLVVDALAAAMLWARYDATRDLRVVVLATAYASSGAAVVMMMFSLPGVVDDVPRFATSGAASGWLWLARHVGPPALIAVALMPWPFLDRAQARPRRRVGVAVLFGGLALGPGLLLAALLGAKDRLPRIYDPVTFEFDTWVQVVVVAVNVAAVGVAVVGIVRRADTTALESWSVLAVVAWLGDVALTLSEAAPFTVAFYGARLLGVASALLVVIAMAVEVNRVQRRLATGRRDLIDQVSQLVEAAADRDHMVAVVSHELRNPLAGLVANLELLAEDDELPPEVEQRLTQRSWLLARRLTLLSEDLLTNSTRSQGEIILLPQELVVAELISECAAGFPGLDLIVHCPRDLRVYADPLRLQQVLTNLVRNAQKHGREPVTVTAAAAGEGALCLEVADEGPGVSPDLVPVLFRSYSRGASVRAPGAGLGLSVVADLVRAHGGTVAYDASRRGFVVRLPAVVTGPHMAAEDPATNAGRRAGEPVTSALVPAAGMRRAVAPMEPEVGRAPASPGSTY